MGSAYHPTCLGLETLPDGDWFCPPCLCGVCGNGKFEQQQEAGNDGDILACYQCERKFHMGCLRNSVVNPCVEIGSDERVFCSRKCEDICLGLRALVGKPVQVGEDGLTWTLLKSCENDPKLNAALSVMHQCFEPAKDPLTHRDVVEDVIFGRKSELSRLNFGGFHVAVLGREEELISVATVRIYGDKLAEVPLVATGFEHRRLGMCRFLMGELEKKMSELGVEKLILPAAPSVLQTWVGSFGFSVMSIGEKLELLRYNPLDFQETFMCQKLLVKKKTSEAKTSPLMEDLPAEAKDGCVNNGYYSFGAGSSGVSAKHFMDCGLVDQGIKIDMAGKVGI